MKTNRVACISTENTTAGTLTIGEIYDIVKIKHNHKEGFVPGPYYMLKGIEWSYFHFSLFRPVDNTFGEVVAEIIEKQIEVEEMEKISV